MSLDQYGKRKAQSGDARPKRCTETTGEGLAESRVARAKHSIEKNG